MTMTATRTVTTFDGRIVPVEKSRLGDDAHIRLGTLYRYYLGQDRVDFCRGGNGRDYYVWSSRQGRLASYTSYRDLKAAYDLSNNSDGAYGCAYLVLRPWEEQ